MNEIEVKLLANGKEVQTAKLNEANSWKHTFKDLPVYDDNGKEIVYTVKEVAIEGYESKIEGNAGTVCHYGAGSYCKKVSSLLQRIQGESI